MNPTASTSPSLHQSQVASNAPKRNSQHLNVRPYLAALPFVTLIALFLLAPLAWVLLHAVQTEAGAWSVANLAAVFRNPFYAQSLGISLKISAISAIVGLVIGFQGAYSLYRIRHSLLGRFWLSLNSLLSNFSGVPLAFAMMIVFGNAGIFTLTMQALHLESPINAYSYTGILISYIYFQIPLAILLMYPAIESLKAEWQENAALLGATGFAYWRYIALPVLIPAILGTLIILFANALGAYATAYALTGGSFNILPIRISTLIAGNLTLEPNMAAALSLVLVGMMLLISLLHQYLLRRYQR